MPEPFSAPPPVLNSARVLYYVMLDDSIAYTRRHLLLVDGIELGRVPCLAICQNKAEPRVLQFHCDRDWTVLGCSAHDSVDAAQRWAEDMYPGVATQWIESVYSEEDAEGYLDKICSEGRCSFCGRRADQVDQIIESGGTRICDRCVKEFHQEINASPSPEE